ncbi:hypothetical protein [Cupriavidus metallidurans]|nr:hypothetical protein [Cupriavidus metallidurans]
MHAATTKDWVVKGGRIGAVVLGGPVLTFTNGSAQQQIAMFCGTDSTDEAQRDANAAFAVAMHQAFPDLIAYARSLSAELAQMRGAAADARSNGFKDCIDAIRGAIALGQQNENVPPSGHWLAEFWGIGSKMRGAAEPVYQRLYQDSWHDVTKSEYERLGPSWRRTLYTAPAAQQAQGEAMTLDAGEIEFLAARLRRLFAHFRYQIPHWAHTDDRKLIGIAPSCISAVLANLAASPAGHDAPGAAVPDESFIGVSATANFDEGTWTFLMDEGFRVSSGKFLITPLAAAPNPERGDAA